MRVVMVSKALVVGAYQRKLEELARQPGIELSAVVPSSWREGGSTTALESAHTSGYELIVAPIAFNGSFHLHFYPGLGSLLRRLRPDILHMDEEPYNLATWHALRLASGLRVRSLFFTWQNLLRRYPWPFRSFEQANYRRSAYAIAGNHTALEVLRSKGYRGPVTVIPQFGVDPVLFSPAPSQPGWGAEFVIGYAGRLVEEKGVDVLLHACAAADLPAWRLVIRGEGPERKALERLVGDLGIASQVQFLGKLPSTQMPAFYRSLDVFVLPSLTRPNWAEQFARVLIEAMACGVPILGSDSGEIPQVLGEGGLVFEEGDAAALGDLLADLARDVDQRRFLGNRGRQRVLNHFTQEHVAAATAHVYREIAAASR